MAGAPAYRMDRAYAAEPARRPAPAVTVVPGSRQTSNPTLNDSVVSLLRLALVAIAILLVIGFVRVTLSSQAYTIASESADLRMQIEDARTTGESLAVQESLLSNPSKIRTEAEGRLGMGAAEDSVTLSLGFDPVSIDASGNLSFAGSVARLAAQG